MRIDNFKNKETLIVKPQRCYTLLIRDCIFFVASLIFSLSFVFPADVNAQGFNSQEFWPTNACAYAAKYGYFGTPTNDPDDLWSMCAFWVEDEGTYEHESAIYAQLQSIKQINMQLEQSSDPRTLATLQTQKSHLESEIEDYFQGIKTARVVTSQRAEKEAADRAADENKSTFLSLFFFGLGAWLIFVFVKWSRQYASPEAVEERSRLQAEEIRIRTEAEEESKSLMEAQAAERQAISDNRFAKYQTIRKEIESMPRYQTWRNEVLERHGKKCAVCGSIDYIEVDHHPISMYKLVKNSGLLNIEHEEQRKITAYEYPYFWTVENGTPLCKKHHDQTSSSKRYFANNG
jgi:hypothetical protein